MQKFNRLICQLLKVLDSEVFQIAIDLPGQEYLSLFDCKEVVLQVTVVNTPSRPDSYARLQKRERESRGAEKFQFRNFKNLEKTSAFI